MSPLYDYFCQGCGFKEEKRLTYENGERRVFSCPKCGAKLVKGIGKIVHFEGKGGDGMKYIMERDASLRSYEFYRESDDQDFLVFAQGVALTAEGQLQKVELCKVVLPDSLLRFIAKSGILNKYMKESEVGHRN